MVRHPEGDCARSTSRPAGTWPPEGDCARSTSRPAGTWPPEGTLLICKMDIIITMVALYAISNLIFMIVVLIHVEHIE